MWDVLIIGAGPIGLACGIEARRRGLKALLIEKGTLVNSLLGYPSNMEFFSTPDLMEIGGYPFPTRGYKPTREEAIEYYRRVAAAEQLRMRLYERVVRVDGEDENFTVITEKGAYQARKVVVATGFFDIPNRLNVPGEDLPKVTHYYKEPFPYIGQKVAVIGGRNSSAKAALDCYRHGADVVLIHRGPALSEKIKYWIRPDLENRIREGSIRAFFNTHVLEIRPESLLIQTSEGPLTLENDWVLAMTGYQPDLAFLEQLGIRLGDDPARTPCYDPQTFETNRPGLYLAGTVCGGLNTSRWFIENSRLHAPRIMEHIATGRVVEAPALDGQHWKTAE